MERTELTTLIEVEFVGTLQRIVGKKNISLRVDSSVTVKDVISELTNRFTPKFEQVLVDPELKDPRPNVLILLNGKEIGVLDGLRTSVESGDKLVLIPVSHGG
ncbi:MAG: MoaD/ThiS family protein [Candidatus Bathyarchaeia archaeon]